MTIQTFSMASLRKIRQHINHGLMLPNTAMPLPQTDAVDSFDDIPEPDSLDALGSVFNMGDLAIPQPEIYNTGADEGWVLSTVNPGDVLHKLPGLQLKSKLRLVAFLFQSDKNGRGIVWAVPEDFCTTDYLEDSLSISTDADHPPHPPAASPNFMDAIEGDRSSASFLTASILQRELLEFGTQGKQTNWAYQRLIEEVPKAIKPYWHDIDSKNLQPKVSPLSDGGATVEFFTCRVKPPIMIIRYVDQYPPENYTAKSTQRILINLKAQ